MRLRRRRRGAQCDRSTAEVQLTFTRSVPQRGQKRSAELQAEAAAASQAAEAAKAAAAKVRKDQENERERVKKLMGDMRKKLDRFSAARPCTSRQMHHNVV